MQRLVEQPAGEGTLSVGGARIARVQYALAVYRHFADDGLTAVPPHLEVEGRLRLLDDLDFQSLHPLDLEYELRLEDGRRLDCVLADDTGLIHSTGCGLRDGARPS